MTFAFQPDGERILFEVRVQPRASRTELAGLYGTALKVRLQAPPVDGRANEALIDFLAQLLKIPPSSVEIVGGWTSRTKRVAVRGLNPDELRQALGIS
jgi:uncharacterized protein (TIGR00251 family)